MPSRCLKAAWRKGTEGKPADLVQPERRPTNAKKNMSKVEQVVSYQRNHF